ncbi:ThiF family adenylyltransferase, partial [bacterium]|nr:ThiF family adenylyltransferase [bacterium]
MNELFSRNELYWGKDAQNILKNAHIAVFGLGGVGGFCAESLARAGIGALTIIDFDTVSTSNINRQLIALHSTVGKSKAKLFKERLLDINPELKLNVIEDFYTDKLLSIFESNESNFEFVADA